MLRTLSILILTLTLCGAAAAASGSNLSVGAGAYVVAFDYDSEALNDFNYQGYAFNGTLALGPSSAIRGDLYFTKHEDHDNLKLDGFDAQFLLGSNLNREGFKMYLLGGYWSESFETEAVTKSDDSGTDFSGWMAGLGLGYNWRSASLDLWGAWRQADDYTADSSKTAEEVELRVGSGALALSIRF